jgi:hypothetical protein
MEKKEDMKGRGIRSSDEADALCLTFALPSSSLDDKNTGSEVLSNLAQTFNRRLAARTQRR